MFAIWISPYFGIAAAIATARESATATAPER